MKSCDKEGNPVCIDGHVIKDDEYFYTVNPDGGYGRDEVLICEKHLEDSRYSEIKKRLLENGVVTA